MPPAVAALEAVVVAMVVLPGLAMRALQHRRLDGASASPKLEEDGELGRTRVGRGGSVYALTRLSPFRERARAWSGVGVASMSKAALGGAHLGVTRLRVMSPWR